MLMVGRGIYLFFLYFAVKSLLLPPAPQGAGSPSGHPSIPLCSVHGLGSIAGLDTPRTARALKKGSECYRQK